MDLYSYELGQVDFSGAFEHSVLHILWVCTAHRLQCKDNTECSHTASPGPSHKNLEHLSRRRKKSRRERSRREERRRERKGGEKKSNKILHRESNPG